MNIVTYAYEFSNTFVPKIETVLYLKQTQLLTGKTMELQEFLTEHKITQQRMADTLGVSKATLIRYLKGQPVPLHIALMIERSTYGKVGLLDLVPEDIRKRAKLC